jgi:excisionase family DNA binding protein
MNRAQPCRQLSDMDDRTAINMKEAASLLGVTQVTAARKVAANAKSLKAWRTGAVGGQWRVRLGELKSFFKIS